MSNTGSVVGNLTAEPELLYTPAGKPYARFSVAVGHRKFNQATNQWEDGLTDFVRCVAFNNEAEGIANLDKGIRVVLLGDWRPNEYTDKEGVLRKDREFVVRDGGPSVRFQTVKAHRNPRAGDGNGGGRPPQQQQAPQNSYGQSSNLGDGFDEQPF